MTTLSERIDHFVRWFVNSSPEVTHIAPRGGPAKRPPSDGPKGREPGRESKHSRGRDIKHRSTLSIVGDRPRREVAARVLRASSHRSVPRVSA